MWDSFNGTLLPTTYGANSPYMGFEMTPSAMMGSTMIPPVPMGYGMGGMGMGGMGMFPGAFGATPYDTFTSSTTPLKAAGLEHGGEHGVGSFLATAGKVLGAVAVAAVGYGLLKGKVKGPKIKAK